MKVKQAIILLTIYLIVFVLVNVTRLFADIVPYIFILTPFLIMMTGYTMLKERRLDYRRLLEDEKRHYHDKKKDQLDSF